MNNIVEIKDPNDWRTMSCIRGSLSFYRRNSLNKYRKAYERELPIYNEYLKKYGIEEIASRH